MSLYEPKGLAREYAPLASNLADGCPHGCLYCYAARLAVASGKAASKEAWHAMAAIRPGALEAVHRQARARANKRSLWDPPWGPVLLNFTHDPYPPLPQVCAQTREAVKDLCAAGAAVKLLTKGGLRAVQDLDLLCRQPGRHLVGASFTSLDPELAAVWEPAAAAPADRIVALEEAHYAGVATWASLEPILYPGAVVELVRELSDAVDHFALGTLNPRTVMPPDLPEAARQGLCQGLPGMKEQVRRELERLGFQEIEDGSLAPADGCKTFYFKSGLRRIL